MIKQNKDKKQTLFSLTQDLKNIIEAKPTKERLIKELEMMRLKIKPVAGDINFIDFKNEKLLEALWKLGKLDEFFNTKVKKASPQNRAILIDLGIQMKKKLEEDLSRLEIKSHSFFPQLIEMEIFRERPKKKN